MKCVCLCSVRGAPGVTTTSLLLASALPDPAVVVEADLSGGVVAARYGLGREPGLTTLAAGGDLSGDGWREHAQDAGGVGVIVGPDGPESARSLWRRASDRIGRTLTASNGTCVVDLGRLSEEVPLSQRLSMVVVLVRPVAEHLVTLSQQLPSLRRIGHQSAVVLVGGGDYGPDDVRQALSVDVLGVLPHDPRAAEALCGTGRTTRINRSRLYRATTSIADAIDKALASDDVAMEAVS